MKETAKGRGEVVVGCGGGCSERKATPENLQHISATSFKVCNPSLSESRARVTSALFVCIRQDGERESGVCVCA